jgi:hypothetical protein
MLRRREMRILVAKMGTADGRLLSGGDENTYQNWLDDYLWLLWGASQEEDDVADAADARLRANAVEDCILFLAVGSRLLFCEFLSLWAAAASPIFDALLSLLLLLPLRLKVPGQQRKKASLGAEFVTSFQPTPITEREPY